MSDWITAPLGEFVTFQRGIDITRAAQRSGDVPVVSSGGIASFHDEAFTAGPGVVIGRKGTLGKTFYLPGPYWPHDTTLWVTDFKHNHPKFVYYFMSKFEVSWLDAGSANPTLNRNHLHPLVVSWPPLAEQQAIAEVLGALDDKIAANTALSDLALGYADSSFPSGGKTMRLSEIVSITKGNSYRSVDLVPSESALVTLKSISRDGRYVESGLKDFAGAYRANQVIHANEIVVAQTDLTQAADVVGRAVRVPGSPGRNLIASLDLAIVRPAVAIEPIYLVGLLRQDAFREHCRSNTTGTTVLHLRPGAMEQFTTLVASERVQRNYAAVAGPLLANSDALAAENRTLAATRDTLLPQLMSGKLRVRDGEKLAAEVGA